MTPDWHAEIVELHEVFERYFTGGIDSLQRVEAALGPDFTIVGPSGHTASRDQTLSALATGYATRDGFEIVIDEARLVADTPDLVVATYIESQISGAETSRLQSTVVFEKDGAGPNGLRWLRVHETKM